jgi:hypothetical protein
LKLKTPKHLQELDPKSSKGKNVKSRPEQASHMEAEQLQPLAIWRLISPKILDKVYQALHHAFDLRDEMGLVIDPMLWGWLKQQFEDKKGGESHFVTLWQYPGE